MDNYLKLGSVGTDNGRWQYEDSAEDATEVRQPDIKYPYQNSLLLKAQRILKLFKLRWRSGRTMRTLLGSPATRDEAGVAFILVIVYYTF